MSTFSGSIPELPGIAIDCFTEKLRSQSQFFFLTHCHSDHMRGLEQEPTLNGPLYLSPVSEYFIRHRFPQHANIVRSLSNQDDVHLTVEPPGGGSSYALRVRTVPAEHCPGSVMFYFETSTARILYTGDFRQTDQTKQILEQKDIRPRIVYLDTTFLNMSYMFFPTREESIQRIINLSVEWLAQDPRNVVSLWLPANMGSEDLMIRLYEHVQQKIHISEQRRGEYMHFGTLNDVLTDDSHARIHACVTYPGLSCRTDPDDLCKNYAFVRTIRPSALRWKGLQQSMPWWKGDKNMFYVCYSAHSSYNELAQFIKDLPPDVKHIRFNVVSNAVDNVTKQQYVTAILQGKSQQTIAGWPNYGRKFELASQSEKLNLQKITYNTKKNGIRPKMACKVDSDSELSDGPYNMLPKRIRPD